MIGFSSRFSNAGMAVGCIITGTKTSGDMPTSKPKNSGGVTPMILAQVLRHPFRQYQHWTEDAENPGFALHGR